MILRWFQLHLLLKLSLMVLHSILLLLLLLLLLILRLLPLYFLRAFNVIYIKKMGIRIGLIKL